MADQPLPPSLAEEGELMLRALVDDLTAIPGVEVVASRDARLAPLPAAVRSFTVSAGDGGPEAIVGAGMALADAVWPIAPESAGILERVARRVEAAGRALLGCSADAVRIAASKYATAQALAAAGVPVVPTARDPVDIDADWLVVKPDDGAGCLDTRVVSRAAARREWRSALRRSHVVQPWVDGAAISLSLLCADGSAEVLCCNRQHVARVDDRLEFGGVVVNVAALDRRAYAGLARAIAGALPGLWGYVGVDLIDSVDGPQVVDLNPRLTTAYAGLAAALDLNVAARILDARRPLHAAATVPAGRQIEVRTDHGH